MSDYNNQIMLPHFTNLVGLLYMQLLTQEWVEKAEVVRQALELPV